MRRPSFAAPSRFCGFLLRTSDASALACSSSWELRRTVLMARISGNRHQVERDIIASVFAYGCCSVGCNTVRSTCAQSTAERRKGEAGRVEARVRTAALDLSGLVSASRKPKITGGLMWVAPLLHHRRSDDMHAVIFLRAAKLKSPHGEQHHHGEELGPAANEPSRDPCRGMWIPQTSGTDTSQSHSLTACSKRGHSVHSSTR